MNLFAPLSKAEFACHLFNFELFGSFCSWGVNNHYSLDLTINLIGHNKANQWSVWDIQLLSLFVCILLSNKWIYVFHWQRQSLALQYSALVMLLVQLLIFLAHVVHLLSAQIFDLVPKLHLWAIVCGMIWLQGLL